MINLYVKSTCTQHCWPFPTKESPLTPWIPAQVKEHEQQQRAKVPDAPM